MIFDENTIWFNGYNYIGLVFSIHIGWIIIILK